MPKGSQILEFLENLDSLIWMVAGILFVALLGIIDYLTGYEISVSLFYLAPIALIAWFVNGRMGFAISILSSLTWLVTEFAAGQRYSQPLVFLWNTLIRLGFFVIVTYLISELRTSHEIQRNLARTDPISGTINARYFGELVDTEIARSRRYHYTFTMAYIDLDNFKLINDSFGHDAGDDVIRFIAAELKYRLRRVDVIARLGGDEFAILLPVTGQTDARIVISRLHANLTAQMKQKGWPVTFSIGALTCTEAPESARELIKMADQLMYEVKNSTKDDTRFAIYAGNLVTQC